MVAPPSPRAVALVLALLTLPLAACIDEPAPDAGTEPAPDPEALVYPATYHFGDGRSLSEAGLLGDTRREALGDFYSRWAQGEGFPEWVSAPVADARVIHGPVQLDFWITTDTVVTSTPGIFPDFVVYFGTTASVVSVVSPNNLAPVVADNTVLAPRDVLQVRATFVLPPGGVVVPSGVGLRVVTAPTMTETAANDLFVLYGSESFPSGIRFNESFLAEDPANYPIADTSSDDHTLAGGSFLHGQEVEGVNILTQSVDVGPEVHGLLVDLDFTGSTPFPDMDLYVNAPNGTVVGLSVTPGADESVHLYRQNLEAVGPGSWSIKVVNYVTVGAAFSLAVTTLGPPTATTP